MLRLINTANDQVLAERVIKAETFFARAKGLMGKSDMPLSEALWIKPCHGGVHTFFMRFPIDLIFVSSDLQVCAVFINVKPWRMAQPPMFSKSRSVFELKTSGKHSVQIGERLYVGH